MELFSSLREDAQAAKLKAIIDKTSTARLYVQVEEKTAVAYSSLNVRLDKMFFPVRQVTRTDTRIG